MRIGGCCSRKTCNAIEYYDTEIRRLDELASEEYDKIVETRLKWRYCSLLANTTEVGHHSCQFGAHRLYSLLIPSEARQFFGEETNFFHGTGIVTFKSIASKQSGTFIYFYLVHHTFNVYSLFFFSQLSNATYLVNRTG